MHIVPFPLHVRFRVPVLRFDQLPRAGKRLLDLPAGARLAGPGELERAPLPVEIRAGWNPQGLGLSFAVSGRTLPVLSDPERPGVADSIDVWIDTRDTQTVHRATRYCHRIAAFPVGEGDDGRDAAAVQCPVARAREDARMQPPDVFLVQSTIRGDGYLLELWIPDQALTGFDPASQPRLGFCCCIHDAEHGEIAYGVGEGFPYDSDPSLWHTLELADAGER